MKPYYVKDQKGPAYFFRCKFGFAIEYRCPEEQIFDFEEKKCVWDSLETIELESLHSDEMVNDFDNYESQEDVQNDGLIDPGYNHNPKIKIAKNQVFVNVIEIQALIEIDDEPNPPSSPSKLKQLVIDSSNVLLQYTAALANGLCKLIGC